MEIIEKLKKHDVEDSMKNNIELFMKAVDELANSEDRELLKVIKAKVDEAEDYFWRPLDSTEFYEKFSDVLNNMGLKDDALEYRKRIGIILSSELELQGKILNFIGDNLSAVKKYEEALKNWPENASAKKGLERAVKRVEKAKANLKKLQDKTDLKGRLKYVSALMDLGMKDKALEVVENIIRETNDLDARVQKALILSAQEKWQEAKDLLMKLKEENPSSIKIRRGINYANYHLPDEDYNPNL